MTIPYDLAPAAGQLVTLADGVDEERFAAPTPCSDWPVVVLLNHILTLAGAFTDGARKKPREDAPEPVPELPGSGARCSGTGSTRSCGRGGSRRPGSARRPSAG